MLHELANGDSYAAFKWAEDWEGQRQRKDVKHLLYSTRPLTVMTTEYGYSLDLGK